MQAIDRLKSNIDDWVRRSGRNPTHGDFDALRSEVARSVPKLPEDTFAAIFTTFLSRYDHGDTEKALEWLGGVSSLLLMDYDETPFSRDDWTEIRELTTVDSGDIDMELLSYILTKVLDHGGL